MHAVSLVSQPLAPEPLAAVARRIPARERALKPDIVSQVSLQSACHFTVPQPALSNPTRHVGLHLPDRIYPGDFEAPSESPHADQASLRSAIPGSRLDSRRPPGHAAPGGGVPAEGDIPGKPGRQSQGVRGLLRTAHWRPSFLDPPTGDREGTHAIVHWSDCEGIHSSMGWLLWVRMVCGAVLLLTGY